MCVLKHYWVIMCVQRFWLVCSGHNYSSWHRAANTFLYPVPRQFETVVESTQKQPQNSQGVSFISTCLACLHLFACVSGLVARGASQRHVFDWNGANVVGSPCCTLQVDCAMATACRQRFSSKDAFWTCVSSWPHIIISESVRTGCSGCDASVHFG